MALIHVDAAVVDRLQVMREAVAHRGAALRLGNVGNAADLLAGLDILDLKVAIGNEVDRLDTSRRSGLFFGSTATRTLWPTPTFVRAAIARLGTSQRYMVLASAFELGQHRLITAALLADGRDLRACTTPCRTILYIAPRRARASELAIFVVD
jgi:hypothetical protein